MVRSDAAPSPRPPLRQYPHNRDRPTMSGLGDDVGFAERFEWLLTISDVSPAPRAGSPSRTS